MKNNLILLVDDSDFYRNHLKTILNQADFKNIIEAKDAAGAISMVKEMKPSLIITDVVMPLKSGIELTEEIMKQSGDYAVIVISSLSHEHIILQSINAGASDFLAKPIDAKQLIDSVEKVFSEQN